MIRLFLTLCFIYSAHVFSQESEYKYVPERNTAEYYFGSFNKGKDISDVAKWYGEFAKWAETQGGVYDSMTVALLQPYFHRDLASHDFMWVNNWPDSATQFKGLEVWTKDPKANALFAKLPAKNSQVVSTVQWAISQPRSTDAGNFILAQYNSCKLNEGTNLRTYYDAYVDFAKMAQENGDVQGRKLIIPGPGYDGDADFIRLVYTSAVSERGEGIEFWRSELRDTDERRALVGMADCGNGSIYVGPVLRSPN